MRLDFLWFFDRHEDDSVLKNVKVNLKIALVTLWGHNNNNSENFILFSWKSGAKFIIQAQQKASSWLYSLSQLAAKIEKNKSDKVHLSASSIIYLFNVIAATYVRGNFAFTCILCVPFIIPSFTQFKKAHFSRYKRTRYWIGLFKKVEDCKIHTSYFFLLSDSVHMHGIFLHKPFLKKVI